VERHGVSIDFGVHYSAPGLLARHAQQCLTRKNDPAALLRQIQQGLPVPAKK
jgi:hypothetical protein